MVLVEEADPKKKPQKAEDLGLEKLRFQHERCEEGVLWEV